MYLKEQPQELLGRLPSFFWAFHVDAEQHELSIMALINRSESLCWELMPLQGTEQWRSYIKTTCDIGLPGMLFIQVVHKAGSSSQVPVSDAHQGEAEVQEGDGPATEPQEGDGGSGEEEEGHGHTHFEGAIDEEEVNEELLGRFEMEANGDEHGLEEDCSDDEDDPLVPMDWDTYNFSQLSVNAGENVAWEYRENAAGCKPSLLEQLDASHRYLSSGFVASQMFAKIVENTAFEHKSIILAIEEKFRYHIS
jgi:hypothetical protein